MPVPCRRPKAKQCRMHSRRTLGQRGRDPGGEAQRTERSAIHGRCLFSCDQTARKACLLLLDLLRGLRPHKIAHRHKRGRVHRAPQARSRANSRLPPEPPAWTPRVRLRAWPPVPHTSGPCSRPTVPCVSCEKAARFRRTRSRDSDFREPGAKPIANRSTDSNKAKVALLFRPEAQPPSGWQELARCMNGVNVYFCDRSPSVESSASLQKVQTNLHQSGHPSSSTGFQRIGLDWQPGSAEADSTCKRSSRLCRRLPVHTDTGKSARSLTPLLSCLHAVSG